MDIQNVDFDETIETYQGEQLASIRAWAQGRSFEGRIQIEIGSNRGRFLRGLAGLYPSHSAVGVEMRRRFVETLEAELAHSGPANAHILCADANLALPMLFADRTLARVYVLFPDPWWKKRHAKRRLLTPRFLRLISEKLALDGQLIVKTDVEPYAEMVEDLVHSSPRWRRLREGDEGWPQDEPQWPHTTRERKILGKGLPIWKIYAAPTGSTDDDVLDAPPHERFEKPEVAIEKPLSHRPRLRR